MSQKLKEDRKEGKIKTPSPCRWNRMLCAIDICQNTSLSEFTRMKLPFLPFDKPNLCNDQILIDTEYIDHFYFLNQVDSNTDLLDDVL